MNRNILVGVWRIVFTRNGDRTVRMEAIPLCVQGQCFFSYDRKGHFLFIDVILSVAAVSLLIPAAERPAVNGKGIGRQLAAERLI